jgi:hypothetical protein
MSADPCACDCCEPPVPPAPRAVGSLPGLPAVEYRIGTYATFREALIERLASSLALRGLTTRDDSDYAMALLDSWAYVADILSFYTERGVNETFLRTARLRESIGYLAALVGYDPSPGLSATASLAFALDVRASFALSPGVRVQSVPAPGENAPPVKFETLEALAGIGALSRVGVVGAPVPVTPLAAGAASAHLPPGAVLPPAAQQGAALVAWSPGSAVVERKRLDEVTDEPPAGGLAWSPPLQQTREQLSVYARVLRVFGYDAPPRFIATVPPSGQQLATVVELVSGGTPMLGSEQVPYDYNLPATTTLDLDREYADLRAGAELLIPNPTTGATARRTVTAVEPVAVRFGPLRGNVTRVTLSAPIDALGDRRAVMLYELAGDVPLWDRALPAQIAGGVVYALLPASAAPERGRAVVLCDAGGTTAEAQVVSAVPAPDLPGHTAITVSPPPASALDAATAVLLGNVVRASHGEAVRDELLGTGDASTPNQRLRFAKAPLTRVPEPGALHGGRNVVEVRVDGLRYHERERLYGAGPDDRVFVVETDDDGTQYARFGDGVQGARPPTGAQVRADYRRGLGLAGNVGAGALSSPLTRPKGLKGVVNPVAAGGGAEPETAEQARENAPNTVRTFDRIVSLRDVEDQARANALVAKAAAAWTWVGADLGVALTVAGPAGALLTGDQLADLRADLDARRDPNRPLLVRGYRPVALSVKLALIAIDPDRRADDVREAAAALLAHFAFASRRFGRPVRLSEVFVAAQAALGVLGIDVNRMTLALASERTAHQLNNDPVQERIDLRPDELATLAPADLEVTGP